MLFELGGFLVRNANLMSTEMSRLEVWACDVITLCEEEGWGRLTARGRDGLAAELKDLQFSQPEHRVTLAKDKGRKSIHCYWKFSNQQLQFKMWQPSGDLNPNTHRSDFGIVAVFYYISEDHHHTDQLVMIRACLGGQDLLLFVW